MCFEWVSYPNLEFTISSGCRFQTGLWGKAKVPVATGMRDKRGVLHSTVEAELWII
jgi:hypothetical protein